MKNLLKKRWLSGIIIIIISTIIDRITKIWAAKTLTQGFDIAIIPGVLELQYVENTGAAFSILTGKIAFFLILTVILCIVIVYIMLNVPADKRYTPFWLCLVFLLAGALGNFYDRLFYHYVVDFISFVLINFPVFNVADIYVTCSMVALIVLILFYYNDEDLNILLRRGKR